ncbi:hypothetical protein B0J17DRAFT_722087 [Rhizoctonia solani]|nr:hypothetical protein B0J17DRAFT_722087 [Rhizoctonia solani]
MVKNKHGKGAEHTLAANGKKDNDTKPNAVSDVVSDNEGKPPSTNGRGAASTGGDTRPSKNGLKESPSPTQSARWPDFQTSDLEVMVAGTAVFRLHQEIMAAHSKFFQEQLQVTVDSEGLVIAPRSKDVPVVVLRDICVDAFTNVVSLIYPRPGFDYHRTFTTLQAEELLQTAHALGMPWIVRNAIDILSRDPNTTPISLYLLAKRYVIADLQVQCFRELVYRARPLGDEEALALGAVTTAQIARLREIWRAGIFAKFEPVQSSSLAETKPHRSGDDSDLVQWSGFKVSALAGARPELGRCQQAILEALKVVFNVDGPKSEFERYILREESSIMRNLAEWLRLGKIVGGTSLCQGCMGSIDRAVRVYCRKEEMDLRIEREIGTASEVGEQPFFDC